MRSHNSGDASRTQRRTYAAALSAAVMLASCSLLLEVDAKQCQVDTDCVKRGLTGAVCSDNLCQPAFIDSSTTPATTAPNTQPPPRGGAAAPLATAGHGTAPSSAGAGAPAAGGSAAADSGMNAAGGRDAADPAGSSASGASAASGAGAGAAAVGGAGAAATAGACAPALCPECQEDRDCEQRGIIHGVCSAGICYMPAPECSADQDCVSRGPEFAGGRCLSTQCLPNPRWRCEPPPKAVDGETRQITVPVIDALSLGPLAGITISACDKRDLQCERPAATAMTGKDGKLVLMLPTNFAGYLQQNTASGYMPALYFLPALLPDDGVLDGFPMLSSGFTFESLAASLGQRVDSTRGHMMLIAQDCFRKPVEGVTFSSPQADMATTTYYVQDNLPSKDVMATYPTGQGGFLNFPAGTATLVLTQAKPGIELNEITLIIRAGYISVAFIPPMSR